MNIWERILELLLGFASQIRLIPRVQEAIGLPVPQGTVTVLAATILAYLQDNIYGLAILRDRLDEIQSPSFWTLDDVMTAIANITPTPPAPPPSAEANAAAVWAYINGSTPNPGTYSTGGQLAEAWGVAHEQYLWQAARVAGNPLFSVESPGGTITALSSAFVAPTPDFSDILPGESVVAWLNRTDTSGRTWAYDSLSGLAVTYDTLAGENWYAMRCLLREGDLRAMSGAGPPIWPGLANITLGVPVALVDGLQVAGPLHGVLVDLTAPPTGGGVWPVGGQTQYYNWGQVGFETDSGQLEPFQWLGWGLGVYMPRQMVVADRAHFRVVRSPTGTVRPFTINSA